ncbi:MAG: hypothetical protein L0G99_00840 [Propionibacteriales bacterium]|nr:hypothetical protein [Propionibacteriales bacterium]
MDEPGILQPMHDGEKFLGIVPETVEVTRRDGRRHILGSDTAAVHLSR